MKSIVAVTVAGMVVACVAGLAAVHGASAPPAAPLLDNPRVTVWDVTGSDMPTLPSLDAIVVLEAPAAVAGKVLFVPRGGSLDAVKTSGATRLAVIAVKDEKAAQSKNPSDAPEAFPRPGKLTKALDNTRATVWDYTFERGTPVPLHFHSKDIVTVYLTNGTIESTTSTGEKASHTFTPGSVRFNPQGRLHTEMLVSGEGRIIAAELK